MNHRELSPGTILDDRYTIEKTLGSGGFGITYSAVNERIGLKVCIKEFFNSDYMSRGADGLNISIDERYAETAADEKRRFLKESRIISDFSDMDGVVHVLDYFEANGTAYIVMDLIEGETLKDMVRREGAMEPEKLIRSMFPLMETLSNLHKAGVIHRDISPENIMVTPEGEYTLIDFGAAKRIDSKTRTMAMVYKEGYAPPEQYQAEGRRGTWTDIYALCATLYYCLTNIEPENSLHRILNDELKTPGELGVKLPANLEKIIMKGLRLEADKRWQTTDELIDALKKEYPDPLPDDGGRRRRKKIAIISAVAAVVLFCAGFALTYYQRHKVEIRFRSIETTSFAMVPDENLSAKEYRNSSEVIKGRIEAWAGKDQYLWKADDGKDGRITVTVPTKLFYDKYPDYVITGYLSRPMKLTAAVGDEKILLERSDVESCTVEDKKLPDELLKEAGKEGADYALVKCTLSRDAAKKIKNALPEDARVFHLYYDLDEDYNAHYYETAVMYGDDSSFYVLCTDPEKEYARVLAYDLSHESYEGAGFGIYYEPIIDWFKPDASNALSGENQCDETEISDDGILIEVGTPSDTMKLTDDKGLYAQTVAMLETRLDAIGKPYAIGQDRSSDNIVIKMNRKDLWGAQLQLLCQKGAWRICDQKYGSYHVVYSQSSSDLTLQTDDSGEEALVFVPSSQKSTMTEIMNYLTRAKKTGATEIEIAMTSNEDVLTRIDIDEAIDMYSKTGAFTITDFTLDDYTGTKEEFRSFADYLIAVENTDVSYNVSLRQAVLSDGSDMFPAFGSGRGTPFASWMSPLDEMSHNFQWKYLDLARTIRDEENVTVNYNPQSSGESLTIYHYQYNEDFTDTVLEKTKEIIRKYQLLGTSLTWLEFVFSTDDRDTGPNDAGLYFEIVLYPSVNSEDLVIEIVGLSGTTATNKIRQQLNEKLAADQFFSQINPENKKLTLK